MSTQHDKQLDHIYQALGAKGRFTVLQIVLLWVGMIPCGFQLLSNVFIGSSVPHRCANITKDEEFLDTYGDSISHSNVTVVYETCSINIVINDTVFDKKNCLFGTYYHLPIESSFVSQFDLVCDSKNLARLTQTLVIIGQAFGAMLGSILSDRFGRKPVIVGTHIGLLVSGLVIAYSPNIIVFSASKFMVGAFQQGALTSIANIMLELMRIKDRRLSAALGGLFWASGVIVLDIIAYILRSQSWRTIQLVLSLGTIPTFVEIFLLKESLRWLLVNGKKAEASAYVVTAARMNGTTQKKVSEVLRLLATIDTRINTERQDENDGQTTDSGSKVGLKTSDKMSYLDLFRIPRLLLNTLILWIGWFTVTLGFFSIYLSSTTLSGDRHLNFFLTALMEVPSNIFFYFGLNRYGRKNVIIFIFLVMSVGLVGSGIFRSFEQTSLNSGLSLGFNMIAMAGASGGFGILFFYTPEIFPTNIRTQALGMCSMIGRSGGMLAPFTALLSEKAKWGPGLLIGCLACVVVALSWFLPETNGRELPQTLDDVLSWFKTNKEKKQMDCQDSLLKRNQGNEENKNDNTIV